MDEWLNLNSFIARLFNGLVVGFANFAIFELRNGLEEDDDVPQPIADARIRVACEWVIQSRWRLLQLSLLNSRSTEPEDATHGSPYRGGALYSGTRGFNLERWGFWKRRLAELRKDVGDIAPIDEALEMMTAAEKEAADTLRRS